MSSFSLTFYFILFKAANQTCYDTLVDLRSTQPNLASLGQLIEMLLNM